MLTFPFLGSKGYPTIPGSRHLASQYTNHVEEAGNKRGVAKMATLQQGFARASCTTIQVL